MKKLQTYKNYQAIIEGYGFVYHPVQHAMRFLSCLFVIVIFSYYFQMHIGLFVVLLAIVVLLLPLAFLWQYEYLYEERMFKEFTMMLQQLSSTFKINPKIMYSLQEVLELCGGSLQATLERAIAHIEQGKSYEVAMSLLEVEYPFFVLRNLNTLMIAVESYGAMKYHEGLDLIQDDLDDVIEDMYLHQQELVQTKNKVFVLCLLAIVVAIVSKQMLAGLFDFQSHTIYQCSLFLFVLCLLGSMMLSQRALRHTWLIWGNENE